MTNLCLSFLIKETNVYLVVLKCINFKLEKREFSKLNEL